jgi:glycosyltransferase involved in cell wall biosynthesis
LWIVKRLNPDILQGWMYHGNLFVQLVGFLLRQKVPSVWNVRQSLYNLRHEKFRTSIVIRLCAKLSHYPAKIIYNAQTSAIQHEALGYCEKKRMIIPNGFDTEQFRPSREARGQIRKELELSPSTFLIGLISRYHPSKGHQNFLRAAAQLVKDCPEVHFVLAGRGVDHNNEILMKSIRELCLEGRVHLLGERTDTARVTAALDLATSTSFSEGFPNSIGEAMACGVPCVVTDVGDSAWIVGDTGVVVPPGAHRALAAAWRDLVEIGVEGREDLGAAARNRIRERFNLRAMVAQYEELYRSLLC